MVCCKMILSGITQCPRLLNFVCRVNCESCLPFILTHYEPAYPLPLWTAFKDSMMEDYARRLDAVQAEQSALADLHVILQHSGKTLTDHNLPPLDELPVEEGY